MSQRKIKLERKDSKVINVTKGVFNSDEFGDGILMIMKSILKRQKWFVFVMVMLIGLIYANAMNGDFVSDDYATITQNPQVSDLSVMWHGGNTMTMMTYMINMIFGHSSPIPYHMAGLLLFIIFCLLALLVVELLFNNIWLTRLTMILFAWHPIHVEAVSWISGRIYIILSIYIMLGFLGFIFFMRENKPKYLLITLVTFILGFLTDRPRPFSIILILIVFMMAYGVNQFKFDWKKIFFGLILAGVVGVVVALPNITTRIGIVNGGYNASESIFYNPFFQYPTGLSKYFQLLWFPIDLTLYHTMYIFPVWLNYAILLTYFALLGYFYFRNRPYFFALAFIVAAVLPSIMPIKVSWLVAERYIFLGSLGFCILMALIILDLNRFSKFVVPIVIGFFMSFFGIQTFLRNTDWSTNHKLWVNTCQVSPNSHNAWNNIGDDYDKLNDPINAIKGFTQSTVVKPNYADAFHNRANIFFKMGRLDLARDSYMTALYYSPGLYQTYLSLTQIDLMEGKYDLALEHSKKALDINQSNPQSHYVMAIVYAQSGDAITAEKILKQILSVYPDYKPASDALTQLRVSQQSAK